MAKLLCIVTFAIISLVTLISAIPLEDKSNKDGGDNKYLTDKCRSLCGACGCIGFYCGEECLCECNDNVYEEVSCVSNMKDTCQKWRLPFEVLIQGPKGNHIVDSLLSGEEEDEDVVDASSEHRKLFKANHKQRRSTISIYKPKDNKDEGICENDLTSIRKNVLTESSEEKTLGRKEEKKVCEKSQKRVEERNKLTDESIIEQMVEKRNKLTDQSIIGQLVEKRNKLTDQSIVEQMIEKRNKLTDGNSIVERNVEVRNKLTDGNSIVERNVETRNKLTDVNSNIGPHDTSKKEKRDIFDDIAAGSLFTGPFADGIKQQFTDFQTNLPQLFDGTTLVGSPLFAASPILFDALKLDLGSTKWLSGLQANQVLNDLIAKARINNVSFDLAGLRALGAKLALQNNNLVNANVLFDLFRAPVPLVGSVQDVVVQPDDPPAVDSPVDGKR